jgi:tetratricopeptide (TPR) repeat protein
VEVVLGEGGMGSVYKAWDKELERMVALKLIRHDLTRDPDISQRFKQELLLASKISHRNVLRIHDLGDGPGGTKFISMACVEGHDLHRVLKQEGKLSLERALKIARQLCAALDAAHAEGVVHRDLKPQNILLDQSDHVYVSDFGLAKSLESDLGMTRTGQFLGTPRYMSPEQAEIRPVDHRSDLYAFGLILCELVTGALPFERAQSTMQMMYQRVHEMPTDPRRLNPDLPEYLARIIGKCLERDVAERYQSAGEILADLDAGRPPEVSLRSRYQHAIDAMGGSRRKWIPASAIVLLLALGLLAVPHIRRIFFPASGTGKAATATPALSLAIVPFRNASGDAGLDWLGPILADMLSTDVGQSSSLRVVPTDRMHQVLHDLRIAPDTLLDPPTLRRLSEFSNAEVLVSGQYARFGEQIRIDASVRDLKRNRTAGLKAEARNEKEVVAAVDHLAQAIRENLALPGSAIKELQEKSLRPSTQSLPALRAYSHGVELARQGKNLEADKQFSAATQADPQFALAYSKRAQVKSSLGYDDEAEQLARKAMDLSETLPPREKLLISAIHAQVTNDYAQALDSYNRLAQLLPDDPDVEFALAGVYENSGLFDEARHHLAKVLARDPRSVDALLTSARVETKSGNPQAGLEFLTRGLALAIEFENDEEKAAILQGMGNVYRRLGKQDDALWNYQQSLEIKKKLGDKRGMAASFNQMSQIQDELGKSDEALKGYQRALQLRREIGDKRGVGDSLIDLGTFYHDRGHYDEALKFSKEALQIERELGSEANQGLCLSNIGSAYFFKGEYEDAFTYFQQALQFREKSQVPEDIVLVVHNLAETTAKMGQYDQALRYYVRALDLYRNVGDQRGAAIESYSMGTLYAYQGRYGAAISAKQEALAAFQQMKDRSFWMAEVLSGYALALAEAGRIDEAEKGLGEAMDLARELKSDALLAQVLNYQGQCSFYRGDFVSARSSYERALLPASRSKDREKVLLSRFNLAKAMVKQSNLQQAVSSLRQLSGEADRLGLKFLSAESSVYLAEALVLSKNYSAARQELERAMPKAEKLELRTVLAEDHYLLGTALRLSGKPAEASGHYRSALRLLEEIRKDVNSDAVLQRADLSHIYRESQRWSTM